MRGSGVKCGLNTPAACLSRLAVFATGRLRTVSGLHHSCTALWFGPAACAGYADDVMLGWQESLCSLSGACLLCLCSVPGALTSSSGGLGVSILTSRVALHALYSRYTHMLCL